MFQKISLYQKFKDNLHDFLEYELRPYPTALFCNGNFRKTMKLSLFNYFEVVTTEFHHDITAYVIDGELLIGDDVSVGINQYIYYLRNHYDSKIVVVFDSYSENRTVQVLCLKRAQSMY